MDEKTKPPFDWKPGAGRGALIIHPVAGLLAFVLGAILGCKPAMPDGAQAAYGLQGGANGLQILVMAYLFTLGILPLIISAFGAAIGYVVSSGRYNAKYGELV